MKKIVGLIVFILILPALLFLLFWVFGLNENIFSTYFVGFLTYFGTAILASITIYQNYALKKQSDSSQQDNKKIIELSNNTYIKDKASTIFYSKRVDMKKFNVDKKFLNGCKELLSPSFYVLLSEGFDVEAFEGNEHARIIMYFENTGYYLQDVIIDNLLLRVGKSFEKNYSVHDNIACQGVCFDFSSNKYKMDIICLDEELCSIIDDSEGKKFLIDIKMRLISSAGVETEVEVHLNLRDVILTNEINNASYKYKNLKLRRQENE